jgi:hypothetical protein
MHTCRTLRQDRQAMTDDDYDRAVAYLVRQRHGRRCRLSFSEACAFIALGSGMSLEQTKRMLLGVRWKT